MSQETSLEIAQLDRDVFKLLLNEPYFSLMKNSPAKLRHNAQIRRNRDLAKMLSERGLLHIDANATSLQLSLPTAIQSSYRTEPTTRNIANL